MNILSIHWANKNAPGIRVFGDEHAAIGAGEKPESLHKVGGMLIKWPEALGTPPDEATLKQWEDDFNAKRPAEIEHENMVRESARQKRYKAYCAEMDAKQPGWDAEPVLDSDALEK